MKRAFLSRFRVPKIYAFFAFALLLTLSIGSVYSVKASNQQPPGTNAQAIAFKNFVGPWVRHGAGLQFNTDGSGTYNERIYQWCGPTVKSPCDTFQGNNIVPGDEEKIQFIRSSDTIAYGKVISSTIKDSGLEVTLTYIAGNDTVSLASQNGHFATPRILCGPRATIGLCGA